ncbi:MAG: hypothetical protein ACRDPK_18865 [Carbonactinosporaceae bacterium]
MTLTDEQPRTRVRLPDEAGPLQSSRRPPWVTGAAALTIVALIVGAVVYVNHNPPGGHQGHPGGPASEPKIDPDPISGSLPDGRAAAGVPVGYRHSAEGAQSAAANYAVAYGSEAMFDPAQRRAIVAAIADPAVATRLAARLDTAFAAVSKTYGLDGDGDPPEGLTFVCRTLPVGVRLVSYGGDTAVVAVWINGIIGLAGDESTRPVAEGWHTMTVRLRWVEGDWRWRSFTQRDGPTPVSGRQPASGADEIARAVTTYEGLRYGR